MQIPPTFEQQKNPTDKGYARYLATVLIRMWGQLATVVNYGIQFYNMQPNGSISPGNIRAFVWTGILTVGNNTFAHNLGYPPKFVLPTFTGAPGSIYIVSSDKANITVNSNVSTSAALLIT